MSNAVAPNESPTAADLRLAAFLARDCPEVFHSVATPTDIWQADPYDVETIHAEARGAFERLLRRGGQSPAPPSGAVLVLQGEGGSGKTHLMRAFRTRAHAQGLGYCVYLQMTAEASNYARYILNNLIDGLEQRYAPDGPSPTGLARLSTALLESVPELSENVRESFRDTEFDPARLVDDYADWLSKMEPFQGVDLELLRIFLHLERNEPRVRSRALMWLRCQDMRPEDRELIGGAVSRTDDADPMRMLQQLARLVGSIHHVPLVLLIDQLEDMANQSAPVERFLKVVDAITAFTDNVSNAVVVLACLEDYFKTNLSKLIKSKQDRLIRDPEPIRLLSNRTVDEIKVMTARRLGYLYKWADVAVDGRNATRTRSVSEEQAASSITHRADEANELYPFRDDHLVRLQNMRARDALDFLRQHHQRCIKAGRWEEPEGSIAAAQPSAPSDLDALWNDFRTSFAGTVPDDEEELTRVLADAIRNAAAEGPDGCHFGCAPAEGRYLEVETHRPDNGVDKRLVALCNANTRGPAFGRQITELEKRAGEIPVAIVRTTDFPKTGKALAHVDALVNKHGEKIVVADSEWRRMLAFVAFRKQYEGRPDFAMWQKTARPLGELQSLQKILKWSPVLPPAPPLARDETEKKPSHNDSPAPVLPPHPNEIVLGHTLGVRPAAVTFKPNEFMQHAAFIGGTGSGKTTAALNLIEQLLARGVPAVLLDRKGDLCRYADPVAWERPLNDPARAAARKALRGKLDVAVYTPGEPNGRPLVLPVVPPGFNQLADSDRERFAQYAAAALGSMLGFKSSDADKGQRAILAKAIETLAEVPCATITVPTLRDLIEQQDDALLDAIGGAYPDKYYERLAQRLLTLELNNKQLLTGAERLDVDALLGTGPHARPGRVRLSVISTRFLGDAAKVDFWVSQLLVGVSRWCAKSPQARLQAVFFFDEADLYLPSGTKQPATKAPMEDLLKRARSAGVGLFLGTQSPGDFDYKCKENVRTWLIGSVKESRAIEKLKPMLAAAKGGAADKLAGQATGEFYLVRESSVTAVQSAESLLRTEQMAEYEIAEVARLNSAKTS